jgi:hypothetical protein
MNISFTVFAHLLRAVAILLLKQQLLVLNRSRKRAPNRAALTIAILLGWEHHLMSSYVPPDRREAIMVRVREWAQATASVGDDE